MKFYFQAKDIQAAITNRKSKHARIKPYVLALFLLVKFLLSQK